MQVQNCCKSGDTFVGTVTQFTGSLVSELKIKKNDR